MSIPCVVYNHITCAVSTAGTPGAEQLSASPSTPVTAVLLYVSLDQLADEVGGGVTDLLASLHGSPFLPFGTPESLNVQSRTPLSTVLLVCVFFVFPILFV